MYPVSFYIQTTTIDSQYLCSFPVWMSTAHTLRERWLPPAQRRVAWEIPGAARRGLLFHCCSSRLACGASVGGLVACGRGSNKSDGIPQRGSMIQACRGELTRTRANPFFILPCISFLLEVPFIESWSLCCCELQSWLCVFGGRGWRKGTHAHMPCLPPFFFLLSLIMKYWEQAANEPKLPPVSLFFAFRLSLQSKLLFSASCSSNITPAWPSLSRPHSNFRVIQFLSLQFTKQGRSSHLSYLNPYHVFPLAIETSFLWHWVELGFKYLHNTYRYNL